MKKNKFPFFCYHKSDNYFWFRIYGYGLHFTKARPLFSERNGLIKKIKLFKNWRMGFLIYEKR